MKFVTRQISSDFDRKVGLRIRKIRRSHGLSQVEFAAEVYPGIAPMNHSMWVSRVENGVRPLNAFEAVRIAMVFRVRLKQLLVAAHPAAIPGPSTEAA